MTPGMTDGVSKRVVKETEMSSNVAQRILWVLWPSFMMAAIAELLFFAVVDPHDISIFGVPLEAGRMTGYAVGFYIAVVIKQVTKRGCKKQGAHVSQ